MSSNEPTYELVLELINSLRKTQAIEVWVRKDIAEFALGEEDNDERCIHSSVLGQKNTTSRNLVEALKEKGTVYSDQLGCYDRASLLNALELWSTEVKGSPSLYTKAIADQPQPSPQKNNVEGEHRDF